MDIEKYSSAVTLSDMEIFIFPELMYSLVLANIMSPNIWQWRNAGCFIKLNGTAPYKRFMRLKQFIMDEYDFNLDLQTWGLTTKQKEIERFSKYISPEELSKSNALFGYEGDKYYFDIDIRKHFGLDAYDSDIIPYWKTETVEAMDAFRYKQGYTTGAGECVSLSSLYAAASFIVCGIPLDDIYMVLTPLHSQNFINLNDGILTNNRRVVTKTMWFNGTEISMKAQRALRNEQVTIVSHLSGYTHILYNGATIDKTHYETLINKLSGYLSTDSSLPVIASFLRANSKYQKYFQLCQDCHGQARFIKAEVLFHYEHGSKNRVGDVTFPKLLAEVSDQEYYHIYPLPDRVRCDQFEHFLTDNNIDVRKEESRTALAGFLSPYIPDSQNFVNELFDFAHTTPQLPSVDKNYLSSERLNISPDMTRDDIINYLLSMRDKNIMADLAFYAYRDMSVCQWEPFIKACVERSPVSIEHCAKMSDGEVYSYLSAMENHSIYDNQRLAHPDELANYQRGDGVEKALYMANILLYRHNSPEIKIIIDKSDVLLSYNSKEYKFDSIKNFSKEILLPLKV